VRSGLPASHSELRSALTALLLLFCSAAAALDFHVSLPLGFDSLERSLHLDARQKAQFDVAVGATQRALLSIALAGAEMKGRIAAELSRDHPDLEALSRAQEQLIEQVRPNFRAARDEWTRLYALLDARQVKIARAFVDGKLAYLERLMQRFVDFLNLPETRKP